jgi:hypothetical protein
VPGIEPIAEDRPARMDAGSRPSRHFEGMIMTKHGISLPTATAAVAIALSACGSGSGVATAPIEATVTGLPDGATMQLADNNADILSVSGNGTFDFPDGVPLGSSYDVTISTQPPGSTCAVANATGTADLDGDPITNVAVTCSPSPAIGGTLSGLSAGASLTLADATTTLALTANGTFMFSDRYAAGAPYSVSVASQPSGQICSVANGAGTIDTAGDGVVNIAVSCVVAGSLGGTVNGLAPAQILTLSDGISDTSVTANGLFGFSDAFAAGAPYGVSVAAQPTGQVCTVSSNGNGTIDGNDDPVTTIAVSCANDGTVGGTVSGLASGSSVTLSDGISTLSVSGNGSLAFADVFAAGAPYAINVTAQPAGQTCSIANGNGTFDGADDPVVVTVTCM